MARIELVASKNSPTGQAGRRVNGTFQATAPQENRRSKAAQAAPSSELRALSIANADPITMPVSPEMVQPSQDVPLPEPAALGVQEGFMNSLSASVANSRNTLDTMLQTRRDEISAETERITRERDRILKDDVQPNLEPFREQLERTERERLFINENFEANQKLTNELDTLLTEGNDLIRQMQGIPAANRIVQANVSKAMRDVSARAGVIEAVMNARNSQISQAYQMIDRTTAAITADRQDELTYYQALLSTKEQGLLNLSKEDEKLANEQINLAKGDLERAEKTADYIKSLMIDPETAQFVAEAGVTMLDSVEEINSKLSAQTGRRQVADTKRQYVEAGYEYVPFPTEGMEGLTRVEVNGQELAFRVRPGSQLDLQQRQDEAQLRNINSQIASRYNSDLRAEQNFQMQQRLAQMELAQLGDPDAIAALGYDPNNVNGGFDGAQQYEMMHSDLQMGVDAANQILENDRGIALLTGQIQSPVLAGIGRNVAAGTAGGAVAGTVIPGAGTLAGAGLGAVGGLLTSPFAISNQRLQKDSAIGAINFLINDSTFQEIIDLRAQGVTFGNMTEGERIAAGRAAERLNAAVEVDESGNVTSIKGTPDEVREYVNDLLVAYQGRQEYLALQYGVNQSDRQEAQEVWQNN